MADSPTSAFDPYHKWLGIPPSEQPPDCYRLLGVPQFEADADVIAIAADRQMAHMKSFATGRYSTYSQKLLAELSRARVCLLNPTSKQAYDDRIRASQAAAGSSGHANRTGHSTPDVWHEPEINTPERPDRVAANSESKRATAALLNRDPLQATSDSLPAAPVIAVAADWATARLARRNQTGHSSRWAIVVLAVVFALVGPIGAYVLLRNAGQEPSGKEDPGQDRPPGNGGKAPETPVGPPPPPPWVAEVHRKVRNSIVAITVERADGSRLFGLGVVVGNGGIVATSRQLVDEAATATVTLRGEIIEKPVGILASDPKTSLALLKIEAGEANPPPVTIASHPPRREPTVCAVILSHDVKKETTPIHATIAKECTGKEVAERLGNVGLSPDVDWFQVEPGKSTTASKDALLSGRGEPLFNRGGELVGLCAFTIESGRTTQYAICSKYITGLIPPRPPPPPPPDRPDLRSAILDLSRSPPVVSLDDNVPLGAVVVIEDIKNLDVPYTMSLDNHIVREDQPLDIELTVFPASFNKVWIRLSLEPYKDNLRLRVKGQVDAGLKAEPADLTRKGLLSLRRALKKRSEPLKRKLDAAIREAKLKEARSKDLRVPPHERQLMHEQAVKLWGQVIPSLRRECAVVEQHFANIQELSGIAARISGKTKILYRVYAAEQLPPRHGSSNGAKTPSGLSGW